MCFFVPFEWQKDIIMCKISLFRHTKYFYKFLIHPSSLIHLSWGSEEFFNVGRDANHEVGPVCQRAIEVVVARFVVE